MSFLARLSLANRGLVALIAVVVTGLGFFAIPSLKQQLLPSLDYPAAFVVASYPGVAPEIVEARVVRPIETGVRGIDGLSRVTSTASEGAATLQLEFDFGTNLDDAVNQLQTSLNQIDQQLPEDVDPQVYAGGTDDLPVLILAAGVGTGQGGKDDREDGNDAGRNAGSSSGQGTDARPGQPATPGTTAQPGQSPPPGGGRQTGQSAGQNAGQGTDGGAGQQAATEDTEREFAERLRRLVLPELDSIDGVARTELTGAREKTIVIAPNHAKLAAARIPLSNIGTALQANGVTVPAGSLVSGDRSLTVQTGTPIRSLDELRAIWVNAPAGAQPVRLRDLATVSEKLAPATSYTRTDGAPSLGVAVTAAPGGNAVEISHAVRDRLGQLSAALGEGAQLTVVFDQAPYVEDSIDNLSTEGLLGLLMAVLVILVFLLSVRSTLVTAVSIPLSVVVALIALWAGDQSLNLLTLGALTIAVGRVVDDSIVVLENIKRHLGYGEAKHRAILDGVREVAGAVTASTLTTVAVFAPIALVGGFVGELFVPFALTITVALAASLLVSLTVIPVLAYWFLHPAGVAGVGGARGARAAGAAGGLNMAGGSSATGVGAVAPDEAAVRHAAEERELRSPLQRGYLPVIRFATERRGATVLIGVVVLLGTFALAGRLETNFIDQSGQNTLTISQELPAGTSLASTDVAARKIEDVLRSTDEVSSYQVTVGQSATFGFGGAGAANSALFQVTMSAEADSEQVRRELRRRLDALGEVGEVTVGAGSHGGFATDELEVIVQASEVDTLRKATEQVRAAMSDAPGVTDVSSSLAESARRIEVTVDRGAAAQRRMSEASIAAVVAQAFQGGRLGQVTVDGERLEVILPTGGRPKSADALRTLPLPTSAGPVPLDAVAEIAEVDGPTRVTRIDGNRSATVSGSATGSDLGATTEELTERLDALDLPGDATYTIGGVSADQEEAFGDLGLALLVAIAFVFVIMVATFRSITQALILLVSVPFAATGAIGLLLMTGTPLGVPALIGVLMLVGIVVTNAIVLMDLINQYRAQGMDVTRAVLEGGRRRLRPILMTAIATIFALLPMALGFTGTEGGFISRPLAIVVIGGLFTSTVLTLVLVPTLYTVAEDAAERLRRRWGGHRPHVPFASGVPGGGAWSADAVAGGGVSVDEGGAAAGTPRTATVLRERTDQFEVLRLPKANKSPLHRNEE